MRRLITVTRTRSLRPSRRRAVAIATCVCVGALLSVAPAGAETIAPIFQQALPNAAGKTMTVVTVAFAPNTKALPHRHGQAFLYAYVLKGTIRSQLEGQPAQTFVAGQSWPEPPGSHHVLTENPSATDPAQLLVVFVADTSSELKVDDVQSGTGK